MRDHPFPPLPPDERRPSPPDWLAELRSILFDGSGPAESRLEHFLDLLERRT